MWYVIRTGGGQEELAEVQAGILASGLFPGKCRALYCVRKKRYLGQWHEERERFLPGYLFLAMDSDSREGSKGSLDGAPNTAWVLKNALHGLGEGMVWPVRQEEEAFLEKLTGGKEEIGMSYGVIRDGVLTISRGALAGMESRVRKIDRHKRKGYISMRLGGEEELAEIGLEITEKTGRTSQAPPFPREMPPGNQNQGICRGEGAACGT